MLRDGMATDSIGGLAPPRDRAHGSAIWLCVAMWLKLVIDEVCAVFGALHVANYLAPDRPHWQRVVSEKLGH